MVAKVLNVMGSTAGGRNCYRMCKPCNSRCNVWYSNYILSPLVNMSMSMSMWYYINELQPCHVAWQCSVLNWCMAAESSSSDFHEQFKPGPTCLFPKRFGKGKMSDPFNRIGVTSMNDYIMMLKKMLLFAISV